MYVQNHVQMAQEQHDTRLQTIQLNRLVLVLENLLHGGQSIGPTSKVGGSKKGSINFHAVFI